MPRFMVMFPYDNVGGAGGEMDMRVVVAETHVAALEHAEIQSSVRRGDEVFVVDAEQVRKYEVAEETRRSFRPKGTAA